MPHLWNNFQKQISWTVTSGTGDCPLSSFFQILVIKSVCLFNQQVCNLKNEEYKNTNWSSVFSDLGCFCTSTNTRTTSTEGQQLVLSFHCVQFMSVMSFVSLSMSLLFWRRNYLPRFWFWYQSLMSWSVSFIFVAILLNALQKTQHTTNPEHDSSVCTAWPITCYCRDRKWTKLLSWKQTKTRNYLNKNRTEIFKAECRTVTFGPILY
jgi:hypothetical protein